MIDLHCHILPAIDDGARDLEESLAMARLYLENGFSRVVATPHWMEESIDLEAHNKAFSLLKNKLEEESLALKLYMGHEFYITLNLREILENNKGHSINGGPYVMLEFPMGEKGSYFDSVLHSLLLKGYKPILAHPERYRYVIEYPNEVSHWIERGVLMQINIPSLVGAYGKDVKKTAEIMLDHQMVHFLATDSHSSGRRSPNIMKDLSIDKDHLDLYLRDNPRKVLEGTNIDPGKPRFYKKKRFFFF